MKNACTPTPQGGGAPKQKWQVPLLIVFDTRFTESGFIPMVREATTPHSSGSLS
jgi:hypothetical protein